VSPVRDRPAGIGDGEVGRALAEGWRIHAADLRYAAVGGGSYHWVIRDGEGGRRFVTVDDLDDKPWLGHSRITVLDGLRAAMDTALALRREAGLRFVAAPIPALGGETVRPLDARYAIAVFPFLDGTSGRFGEDYPARRRGELADLLAALHQATPTLTRPPVARIGLPRRGALDAALGGLDQPWLGGPYCEPARELLIRTADHVRSLLARFDQLAECVAARAAVITHGEPHGANFMRANFMRAGTGTMLIDWDTTGLAPPERDLWMIASNTGEELRHYTAATGHRPGRAEVLPAALGPGRHVGLPRAAPRRPPADRRHRTRLARPAGNHRPRLPVTYVVRDSAGS